MSRSPRDGAQHIVIVGAGLAGLVAAAELIAAGRRVTILDQEPAASLGGQAWWSLGGLFLVDTPEQRRMGIRDSFDLARTDWFGSAAFDRAEAPDGQDVWATRWADAYLQFAAGEKRSWLRAHGITLFPVVGWAERGGSLAGAHGNSVPRFHIAWGTGTGVVAPFVAAVSAAADAGRAQLLFRHRVDDLIVKAGQVVGVRGTRLADDRAQRGVPSSRDAIGDFEIRADAVVMTTGGIGGDHERVRAGWPERMGPAPEHMLSGVPASVDGRGLDIAARAGARLVNGDRMWHYTEGIRNWNPVWNRHGIRILPGPSSLWLDASGSRLPPPLMPGFDTLATLEHIARSGFDHTWFVLTQRIAEKELALSGSEQNPDLTLRDPRLLARRIGRGAPQPVETFLRRGADFVVADTLDELVRGMAHATDAPLDTARVKREVHDRDGQLANGFGKDAQIAAIRAARAYRGDRLIRVAAPHRLTDRDAGPLIAIKLHIVTRKTLGGIQTDLSGRALAADGNPVPGLYAAGEAAGFGGGGMHGYRSLEGTFLGGCLFSGRVVGRTLAG